jgi:hypothetical protein
MGLCALVALPVSAQDLPVTITGEITNGTQGGELPAGLPVTLHVYSGGALSNTFVSEADSEGGFSFELAELAEGDQLVAATSYLNISYTSSNYTYQPGQELPALLIAVYETTEDSSHVVISQMTMMLNASEGQLRVGEYYLLSNFGDRTWVGAFDEALGMNTTTQISLTPEAESLWFSGGDLGGRFQDVADGVVDMAPVIPGAPSAEVFFSYAVPYPGTFDFTKTLNLPVDSVGFLLAEESGIIVEGDGIEFDETVDTDTEAALSYIAPGFGAEQTLTFSVSDHKGGILSLGWELGVGALSLVVAGVGIFWLLRKDRQVVLPKAADSLLRDIALLEDQYAAGQIKKGQYSKKRKALVDKIKKLVD